MKRPHWVHAFLYWVHTCLATTPQNFENKYTLVSVALVFFTATLNARRTWSNHLKWWSKMYFQPLILHPMKENQMQKCTVKTFPESVSHIALLWKLLRLHSRRLGGKREREKIIQILEEEMGSRTWCIQSRNAMKGNAGPQPSRGLSVKSQSRWRRVRSVISRNKSEWEDGKTWRLCEGQSVRSIQREK